jgi:hypothetical protein
LWGAWRRGWFGRGLGSESLGIEMVSSGYEVLCIYDSDWIGFDLVGRRT